MEIEDGQAYLGLNALQKLNNTLYVKVNGNTVLSEKLNLKPMEIYSQMFSASDSDKIEVYIEGTELDYSNDSQYKKIKRPFHPDKNLKISKSQQLFQEGCEALEYREYGKAHKILSELVTLDPSHREGLNKLSQLEYRSTNYSTALEYTNAVLKMDTYDAEANYMAGIVYRVLDDPLNALESLGWAARDMKYRSVAFAQMAEIYLRLKNYARAEIYAKKALDFNDYNLNAHQVLLLVHRISGNTDGFEKLAGKILGIDPMNHFAILEKTRFKRGGNLQSPYFLSMKNEFPEETILDLAIHYINLGLPEEAMEILRLGDIGTKNKLWLAYLLRKTDERQSAQVLSDGISDPTDFVFPYRRETIPILQWAIQQDPSWKLQYYLAQAYLVVGQTNKGKSVLKSLSDVPDSDVFYRFRAKILTNDNYIGQKNDYQKALDLSKDNWKIWDEFIQFYLKNDKNNEAYSLSSVAYEKFDDNPNIGLIHAKAALRIDKFNETIAVLNSIQVLPFENASESREIYESAHIQTALEKMKEHKYNEAINILEKSKEWPENIGVGKPYDPDEREQDYLLSIAYERLGKLDKSKSVLKDIVTYTQESEQMDTINHIFGLLASKKLNKNTNDLLDYLEKQIGESHLNGQIALAFFKNDVHVRRSSGGSSHPECHAAAQSL